VSGITSALPHNADIPGREIAEKKGVTPAQLTLAWVLAQGDEFIAIPGTKKVK